MSQAVPWANGALYLSLFVDVTTGRVVTVPLAFLRVVSGLLHDASFEKLPLRASDPGCSPKLFTPGGSSMSHFFGGGSGGRSFKVQEALTRFNSEPRVPGPVAPVKLEARSPRDASGTPNSPGFHPPHPPAGASGFDGLDLDAPVASQP